MSVLLLGLLLFLGAHSLRLFAPDWRNRQIQRIGQTSWKAVIAVVSLVAFGLICWGFGLVRQHPLALYVPPLSLRHLNALFTLLAFTLVVAAYVPRNHLKAWIGHPMLAGTALWAFGHLLATGMLRDVLVFGAFLLWAVVLFVRLRRLDRAADTAYPVGTPGGDVVVLVSRVVTWAAFAFWLHSWWIGVSPFG